MMEIQANPDFEQLKLIMWIGGPVLLVMLAIIGYFLKEQIVASKAIANAVNALNVVVTELKTQSSLQSPVIERRLNDHSNILKEHEKRLTVIETEHKSNHKKTKET
jgi:uncharacterized membrane protein